MALCDYVCVYFDENGNKKELQKIIHPNGNVVELYKCHVNIKSEKMWNNDSSFLSPIVAKINSGDMAIAGFNLNIERSKNMNAVFLLVHYYENGKVKIEGGIGSHGWEDTVYHVLKELGREDEVNDNWASGYNGQIPCIMNVETYEEIEHTFEPKFIGMNSDLFDEYKEWILKMDLFDEMNDWAKKIKKELL